MKKLTFSILSLIVFALPSLAGEELFRVLACKNAFNGNDTLQMSAMLNTDQSLTLKSDGYVALIHKSGVPVELKDKGHYNLDSLAKSLMSKGESYSEKYSSFLVNGFAEKMDKNKNYDQVAAVKRDYEFKIFVLSPEHFQVVKGIPLDIHWEALEPTDSYEFYVTDFSETKLFVTETKNDYVEVDFAKLPVQPNGHYIIKVYSKEKQQEIYSKNIRVDVLSEVKTNELVTLQKKLVAQINEESAVDNLMLASFYDSKGLTVYAASCLGHAVKLEPEVSDFKKTYRRYLGMNAMLPEQQ